MRNQAVIYNLDHKDANDEVKFIYNTAQFIDPDHYVDTGLRLANSYDEEDEEGGRIVRKAMIFSNETKCLHF